MTVSIARPKLTPDPSSQSLRTKLSKKPPGDLVTVVNR